MTATQAEDLRLAERILGGDERAFEDFVARCHPMMRRLARCLVSNPTLAEDVVQEAWSGVIEGLSRFEGRSRLATWACSILLNCAKKRLVREGRTIPFSGLGNDDAEAGPVCDLSNFDQYGYWRSALPAWGTESAEELLLRQEVGALLEQEIERLPPRLRAVLTLRDREGLSAEEVCNVLGLTDTNQRVLLHRARAKLRLALDSYLRGAT